MATEVDTNTKGVNLGEDFVYNQEVFRQKEIRDEEIQDHHVAFSHCFSFDSRKRNNLHILDEKSMTVLTIAGNVAQILNLNSGSSKYIFGLDDKGIGSCCVHPSKTHFALGGKGTNPNVYIYRFPSLEIVRVLRDGTERAYSCLAFSGNGENLASVGSYPDFLLTLWDWKRERIILRNKAFAQEIYNVSFAGNDEGTLTTSGLGHIRFWKMASTFTGIKLQGDIGKFGKVELSDVSAYAAMADGKVLSGSENGSLLLWEGNFIKLEIRRPGDLLPHEGDVQVCHLIEDDFQFNNSQFLTAGDDGWLRWWSASKIDVAEVSDEEPFLTLTPTREVLLEGIKPQSISLGENSFIVQDYNGSILKVAYDDLKPVSVYTCHSGPILGLDTSPKQNFSATIGEDGTVKLYDHVDNRLLLDRKFSSPGSCILWAPTNVDPKATTVIAGFKDGVFRSLLKAKAGWKLLVAIKPHNKAVTAMKFSSNGQRFATTSSEEATVFFFEIGTSVDGLVDFVPLGFFQLPEDSQPSSLDWNDDSSSVIVGCSYGRVVKIEVPKSMEEYSTKESFQLDLPNKTYSFKRPLKSQRGKPGSADTPEALENDKSEEANEGETSTESNNGDADEKTDEVKIGDVCKVIYKLNDSNDNFYVTLTGFDAGPIYECSWDDEYPVGEIHSGEDDSSPKKLIEYSWSGRLMFIGGMDGRIFTRSPNTIPCYGSLQLHDGSYGQINGAKTSYDDNFLLSVGSDGAIHVLKLNVLGFETASSELKETLGDSMEAYNKRKKRAEELGDQKRVTIKMHEVGPETNAKYKFPPCISSTIDDIHDEAYENGIKEASDITDASTYSIQDDKLKTEEDNRTRLAEIKKDRVRQVIQELRGDFEALLKENSADIEPQQLQPPDFMIDPALEESIEKETQAKIEEVYKELEFDSEKSKKRLEKLKMAYLEPVILENIELKALKENSSVSSFRLTNFDEALEEALEKIKSLAEEREDLAIDQSSSHLENSHDVVEGVGINESGIYGDGNVNQTHKNESGNGWEARKARRKERKQKLTGLLQEKPDENMDDPNDVAAINWVRKNMGDYKLKTAKDYQVPEEHQVNAEKKRRECVLLEDAIMSIKSTFNERFLALRELKRRIIEEVNANVSRIKEIDLHLEEHMGIDSYVGADTGAEGISLEPDSKEWPEERLEYSVEELDAFLREKVGVPEDSPLLSTTSTNSEHNESKENGSNCMGKTSTEIEYDEEKLVSCIPIISITRSDFNKQYTQEEKSVNTILLDYERKELVKKNRSTIQAFDSAIYELRKEKGKLSTDLQAVQLRQITLYYELMLLKEFEKTDISLANKMESCLVAKSTVTAEIASCQEKLSSKQAEIEVWQDKNRKIMDEFNKLVDGESNPFHGQLLKLFKRKIKRSKIKEGGDEDDSDMSSSDESDYDDESDFDEDEIEEDICPEGCDQELYEKVLELREKRLDQEEILNDFTKVIDEIRKANDRHKGREKQINKDLTNCELEIQQFQNEKQQKLNELNVFVVLNISQLVNTGPEEGEDKDEGEGIQEKENDNVTLPSKIDSCLVFSMDKIKKLNARIGELHVENKAKKHEYKELHHSQKKLTRERKVKEAEIATLQARCDELQMLKFGQIIDLDVIEKMGTSKAISDLHDKIQKRENEQRAVYKQIHGKIHEQREELLHETKLNTKKLQLIGSLTQKQQSLEAKLNSTISSAAGINGLSTFQQNQEQKRLTQLIRLQSREIESLKSEIQLLKNSNPRINQNQVTL